jgi:membrane protease YdiL (CAAX protease family)
VVNRPRLVAWSLLVLFLTALGYASRFTGNQSDARDAVYSWATFAGGVVQYAVWLAIVLGIGAGASQLFALRKPRSNGTAAALGVAVLVGIFAVGAIVSALPIENPGDEQGLTPTVWEPAHAGAFAANCVLFCVIAPFVEELTFRGLGQSLLYEVVGRWPSILIVGVAFGVAHGLVDALLVLVPFGIFLAILRDRVDSVYPGMVVHGVFNGLALAASVLR